MHVAMSASYQWQRTTNPGIREQQSQAIHFKADPVGGRPSNMSGAIAKSRLAFSIVGTHQRVFVLRLRGGFLDSP